MFRVKRRRRRLISKSSFRRHCVGRIRDTCSQLTWKSHSPRHFTCKAATFLTPAQTSDLHELGHCKSKSMKKTATSPFDIHVASSSVVFMIHAANWHETYVHTHTHTYTLWTIKRWQYICDHNSGKSWSIFIIFALLSAGRIVLHIHDKNVHLT